MTARDRILKIIATSVPDPQARYTLTQTVVDALVEEQATVHIGLCRLCDALLAKDSTAIRVVKGRAAIPDTPWAFDNGDDNAGVCVQCMLEARR